jgi:Helicase HerA-like C-terminal
VQDGSLATEAVVRVPLRMMNRHGLIAGATGTGKTMTLQTIAKQLSDADVAVFAADVKGDVSGLAAAAEPGGLAEKRMGELGLPFEPRGFPVEYFSLGGIGPGVPVRATVSDFGPQLVVSEACSIARELQPAMVVLEDIDLVAQERTMDGSPTSLLFELLNEMDGIGEDSDVIFLMTTNRPDLLEPALAARPGRVDQAVELPPPDEESRAQLIELFGSGLDLRLEDQGAVVAATKGVSPAFLRELVRQGGPAGGGRRERHGRGHPFQGRARLARERRADNARAMLGADAGEAARRLGSPGFDGAEGWVGGAEGWVGGVDIIEEP